MFVVSTSTSSLWAETPRNTSLGTIWIVKESLWKERIQNYDSPRETHFGLSVLRLPFLNRAGELLPMLHGRSKRSGDCFWTTGLSEVGGPDYPTYFGHLRPVPLPASEVSDNPSATQSDLDLAWAYDCLRIRRNDHKPELLPSEKGEFVSWLKHRRFW
jgi:hypothetical protein